ncbi:FAD-dependent oxidoreductase [Mesorhizobium sp.]|uniref:NAD(P)/FAD-dependent oxidoreductase n=1 Tax=Mesorhizobium sp. TaxID=1871066 RepID=UPI0025BAF313|nr:FAD-dependent oxidoreductase [Mesorhizobium sp.]
MKRYAIVGSGLAGHRAAISLRNLAPSSSIHMFGDESHLPYDRPPLTKDFLLGKVEQAQLTFSDVQTYDTLNIHYHHATRIVAIDRHQRSITTDRNEVYEYDKLLLATGSRPRRLPEMEDARAIYLRTVDDAARLRSVLEPGRSIGIIGAGFVGLEVAAAARDRGCAVCVIEAAPSVLSRGLPPLVSNAIQRLHLSRGVEIVCGQTAKAIEWTRRGPINIELSHRSFSADAVVVGVGVIPNTELAAAAGLEVDNGIVVDCHLQTADPSIFAAGEVTKHPVGKGGALLRLESWNVAHKQPLVAAACMTGHDLVYDEIPWLWSDQFGQNLQILGDVADSQDFLLRGHLDSEQWTLIALNSATEPTGAIAFNSGRDISMMRRILKSGGNLPLDVISSSRPVSAMVPVC